ncbi:MAG: hypothetical protein ABH854_04945 [Candidatus Diapherotrites archaeon]
MKANVIIPLVLLSAFALALLLSGCPMQNYGEFTEGHFKALYPAEGVVEPPPTGILHRSNAGFNFDISVEPLIGSFAETVEQGFGEFYELDEFEIIGKTVGEHDATVEYKIGFGEDGVIHAIERGIECNGKIYWVSAVGAEPWFEPQSPEVQFLLRSAGCVQ